MTSYDLDETVETVCGETGCEIGIHCGEAYLCTSCGDYFCDGHMIVLFDAEGRVWSQRCEECDSEAREG